MGHKSFEIFKGDRIAQIIIEKFAETVLIEDELSLSLRGNQGFGSSGII